LAHPQASKRAVDFSTANIFNPNTREAKFRAVDGFLEWCRLQGISDIAKIETLHVSTYIEAHKRSPASTSLTVAMIEAQYAPRQRLCGRRRESGRGPNDSLLRP
jgi:hypothetical protein